MNNSDRRHDNNIVYPYCNKVVEYPTCTEIKEGCLPCDPQPIQSCIDTLLPVYMKKKQITDINPHKLSMLEVKMFACLSKYGDIYKKLGFELYVNPKTKKVLYPDNVRINANLSQYLRDGTDTPKEYKKTMELYHILLNDTTRNLYNDHYPAIGHSSSIKPKEYGIARVLGPAEPTSGGTGRRRRRKTRKTRNTRKTRKKTRRLQ